MADLRVRRTKKMIVRAFYHLLAQEDFKKITIQQIADAAMINRQTFYLHYQDKYDLLQQMINDLCKKATAILGEQINDLKQPILKTLQEHYNELLNDRDKIYLLLSQNYCGTMLRHTMWKSFLTLLKKQDKLQLTDFQAKVIAVYFMELVMIIYTSERIPSIEEVKSLAEAIHWIIYGKKD